jgi:hypothetical protein
MVIGIVLSIFGLGFFCWLLFTLAVYALPFLAGLTVGLAAFHGGSGFFGALVVGLLVGVTILVLGQIGFATVRTPLIRLLIGLIYAVPASFAGYQLSFALAGFGVTAGGWQQVVAVAGAAAIGLTAFTRMALFVPLPAEQGPVEGTAHPAVGLRSHDLRG